VAVFGQF